MGAETQEESPEQPCTVTCGSLGPRMLTRGGEAMKKGQTHRKESWDQVRVLPLMEGTY